LVLSRLGLLELGTANLHAATQPAPSPFASQSGRTAETADDATRGTGARRPNPLTARDPSPDRPNLLSRLAARPRPPAPPPKSGGEEGASVPQARQPTAPPPAPLGAWQQVDLSALMDDGDDDDDDAQRGDGAASGSAGGSGKRARFL
jgi:hypothetical protein